MRTLQFLGASGGVTGSCYLLSGKSSLVLVDCGMFQGTDDTEALNTSPFPFDVKSLSAVFLTHAHLDHCGRLPLLTRAGFRGKIFTTKATKAITAISLLDAAKIQKEESQNAPLYTEEDVEETINAIEVVDYDSSFAVGEFAALFKNAGHILGSASIILTNNSSRIAFSGDLGNTPEHVLQPIETIDQADIVVMESTYGSTTHPKEDVREVLQKEIAAVASTGGVLLIPAFSIERTQELLHVLGHLIQEKKITPSLPIFLDSPMAIEVTEIFKKFPHLFNKEVSHDNHPFTFPSLVATKSVQESKDILKAYNPKVIIAGSGMMSGGRILHHLSNYICEQSTRILFVGYQAEGTLGREILEGASEITLYEKKLQVRATVTALEAFSSHADQQQLLKWLQHIQGVKKVFLTHGDTLQRQTLSQSIQETLHLKEVFLPIREQVYEIN